MLVKLSDFLHLSASTKKMTEWIPTMAEMLQISEGDILDVGLAQAGSLSEDRHSFSYGAMSPGMTSPNLRAYDPSASRDDPYSITPCPIARPLVACLLRPPWPPLFPPQTRSLQMKFKPNS